jgi:hypothetical protein
MFAGQAFASHNLHVPVSLSIWALYLLYPGESQISLSGRVGRSFLKHIHNKFFAGTVDIRSPPQQHTGTAMISDVWASVLPQKANALLICSRYSSSIPWLIHSVCIKAHGFLGFQHPPSSLHRSEFTQEATTNLITLAMCHSRQWAAWTRLV